MEIKKQNQKLEFWIDENNVKTPTKRLTNSEKVNELVTFDVATMFKKQREGLLLLKSFVVGQCEKAIAAFHEEYNGEKELFKGNYTFYNFDRSIKVTRTSQSPITFDDNIIALAKSKLDEFLLAGVDSKHEYIKEMVLSAFDTTRGNMDVPKVLTLRRWEKKINQPLFTEAMGLINSAIRRPSTAIYYQCFVKDSEGKYEAIVLDFAKI